MRVWYSTWVNFFAVICFGLWSLVGCKTHNRLESARKPAAEPQPLFTPIAATLAQQKMCDEQAGKKFRENDTIDNIPRDKSAIRSYTSHYDPTVNVCYLRVTYTSANKFPLATDVVYDAFGGRIYANYLWINPKNKKFWEVSPSECEIRIPDKPVEKCASEEEFNQLTEKYFGVTE